MSLPPIRTRPCDGVRRWAEETEKLAVFNMDIGFAGCDKITEADPNIVKRYVCAHLVFFIVFLSIDTPAKEAGVRVMALSG